MKIRNRLYMVSGGIYGQLGNVYMVEYGKGCFLVDCGSPASYETIVANIEYWGHTKEDITHVLMTHGHDDHAGTAKYFQENGAKIVVGKADAYMMIEGNFGPRSPFTNHQMPPCNPDILLEGDMTLQIGELEIRVYSMPGHTNGTVIYYLELDDDKILFSGDMFNCDGEQGNVAKIWWTGDMDYSSEKLGSSFEKLWAMNLDPNIVVGGHGNPRIGKDARDMIMLAYKEYLLNYR